MRAICGVHLKDRKRSNYLMLMLGLNETIDQMAMENSVRWYRLVLRREYGHVLKRTLDFEVEGQKRKVRLKVREGTMHFADQSRVLALTRLLLC